MQSVGALARLSAFSLPLRLTALLTSFSLVFAASRLTSGFTDGPILCVFRTVTGLPCPFCGTTRAIGSFVQGDLLTSASLNPLGAPVVLLAGITLLWPTRAADIAEKLAAQWWRLTGAGRFALGTSIFAAAWLFNLPRML